MTNAERKKILQAIMNDRLLYDIATALRSPDAEDFSSVKCLTTARIRGIAAGGKGSDDFAHRVSPLSDRELTMRNALLKKALWHFVVHYDYAVTAIRKVYGYDLTTERKIARGKRTKRES